MLPNFFEFFEKSRNGWDRIDLRQLYLKAVNKSIAFSGGKKITGIRLSPDTRCFVPTMPDRCHNCNFFDYFLMSTRVTCSGYIIMNGFVPLYDLKDVELEVVRLRNVPEYGVVGRLLAGFDLPQLHSGVRRGGLQHLHKQLRGHEVAA